MPKKLETQDYRVLNARRIGGRRVAVGDVVKLVPGTADHLVASGDVELATATTAATVATGPGGATGAAGEVGGNVQPQAATSPASDQAGAGETGKAGAPETKA